MKHLLEKWNACPDGYGWAKDLTLKQIYDTCHRGDWLLWLADKLEVEHNLLILAACDCAESVAHLDKTGVSAKTIQVTRKYLVGEATLAEVKTAAAAATSYAATAYAAAAHAAAAHAAADAAYAAYAVAAAAAAAAADAAAADAVVAAIVFAADATHQKYADLVRKRIPYSLFEEKL
jgi:hypothetical protein